MAPRQIDAGLRHAALGFSVAVVLHTADHFRRGLGASPVGVQVLGNLGLILSVVAVVAILTGHRTAPLVAVAVGFPLAVGFLVVHWLPDWGPFSDSLVEGGASPLSQVASLLEVAGALWLGVAGLGALRRQGGLASAAW